MRKIILPLVTLSVLSLGACAGNPNTERPATSRTKVEVEAMVEAGHSALADGHPEEASQYFSRALTEAPDNGRAKLGLAELKLLRGEYPRAAQMFKDLESDEVVAAAAKQGRGIALLMGGKSDAAQAELEAAVAEDAKLWRAWNALGHIHDRAKRWDEATACYTAAIEALPGSAYPHNNLGYSYLLQGKYPEAARELSEALRLKPDFEVARNNLRLALAWQGRYVEALAGVPREKMPAALNNVGYAALVRGDLSAAEAYLTRAVEVSPSFFEPAAKNLLQLDAAKGTDTSQGGR
ncbi:MAG: tetratricopeptide repeat protein [Solirubrobacterales bacterium]